MARRTRTTKGRWRGGFTLAEGLTASVVLALAVASISSAMSASYQQERQIDSATMTLSLARQLMEEISGRPFIAAGEPSTPGKDAGDTTRATFDSVKDYGGFTETGKTLTTRDGAQTIVLDGESYTRAVDIRYRSAPGGADVTFADLALVTVTVTGPRGQSVQLRQLLSNTRVEQ